MIIEGVYDGSSDDQLFQDKTERTSKEFLINQNPSYQVYFEPMTKSVQKIIEPI